MSIDLRQIMILMIKAAHDCISHTWHRYQRQLDQI
jgi:hypothetical protein